jgi:hypothetical protein
MNEENILTLLMAVGTGLSGAVGILFSIVMKQNTKQIDISKKLGELEGRQDGIKTLSQEVLKIVHNAVLEKTENKSNNNDHLTKG